MGEGGAILIRDEKHIEDAEILREKGTNRSKFFRGQIDSTSIPDHENLSMHSAVPEKVKEALMSQYKHPIHQELEETAKKIGGHGGMDFIMDYRLVYCLRNGLPLDMDVYDLAEWCCMADLTRLSIENGNAPVAVPDFTRGNWNKVDGYHHAFAQ